MPVLLFLLACGWAGPVPQPGPEALVHTTYPGVSPADVEALITLPVETALGTVKGVDSVFSTSDEGSSSVVVRFRTGVDPYVALHGLRKVIPEQDLPEDAEAWIQELSRTPAAELAVPAADAEAWCDRLERSPGVLDCTAHGVDAPRKVVDIDLERLAAAGVSLDAMLAAGPAPDTDGRFLLRVSEPVDPGSWPVGTARLADLASVRTEAQGSAVRLGGQPGARLEVRLLDGHNLDGVLEEVGELGGAPLRLDGALRVRITGEDPALREAAVAALELGAPAVLEVGDDTTAWFLDVPAAAHRPSALPGVELQWPTRWVSTLALAGPDGLAEGVVASVRSQLLAHDGVSGVGRTPSGEPSIEMTIDRQVAARLGVSTSVVAQRARLATDGLRGPGDVWFRLADVPPEQVPVPTAGGGQVPLGQLTTLTLSGPQPVLHRLDGRRVHPLTVWTTKEGARPPLGALALPEGWTATWR